MSKTLALALMVVGVVSTSRAEPEPPDLRISITSLLVARYNPLGLEEQLRFGLQGRLYHRTAPALRDNFVFFGIYPKLNPAFLKIGPALEIQPLSVFNLRAQIELIDYFSSFGYLQSFPSANDEYSDTLMSKNSDAGRNYATTGVHAVFEPQVQMKIGPIAIRNRLSLEYWNMNVHAGDTVWYEPTLDTLVPANGWVLSDDLDALWVSNFRLVVGARYSVVEPLYQPSEFRLGEARHDHNGHQRLGPLVAYSFFDRPYARFNKPSLILILGWYLDSRYRTGQDVSQGIPYVVLAFAFTSDLILSAH